MNSVRYSFEQINGNSRYDMADQFGGSGVKAYLYEKKFARGVESVKDTKEYQQNLLAQSLGYTNYREMGEALKDGKLNKRDVVSKFRELDDAGLMNKDYFTVENKGNLKDKVNRIKKHVGPNSNFASRSDIKRNILQNEINDYARETGFVDENNRPDALLFLQAVESGDYIDSRAQSLFDRYESTFDSTVYDNPDYGSFKNTNGFIDNEYTIDDIAERIIRRF